MAKKKNQYIKKARMNQVMKALNGEVDTKGNKGATAIITIKDLLIAVVAGRFVAARIGGFSVPVGVALTAAGHYLGNKNLQALGIGTMAAPNYKKSDTVSGIDGLDGVKERMKAFKDSLMEDLFLNKVLKKKALSGLGDVQYFNYQDNAVGELAALDNIENEMLESGMQFQGADNEYDLVGMDGMEGMDDPLY